MAMALLALQFEPRLKPAVVLWSQLTAWQRRGVTFDELAVVAGLTPGEFVALIARAAFECTENVAPLIVAGSLPEIVSVAAKRALTPEGFQDRQMFLTSFLQGLHERLNLDGANSKVNPTQTAAPAQPESVPSVPPAVGR